MPTCSTVVGVNDLNVSLCLSKSRLRLALRELDRLGEDLAVLDRQISRRQDPAVKRLLTITGVDVTVATELMAAIGNISRFKSPQKLLSYFGLNPRVHPSVLGAAHHRRISKIGQSHAQAMLAEAAKAPGRYRPSSSGSEPNGAIKSQPSQRLESCGSGLAHVDQAGRRSLGSPESRSTQDSRTLKLLVGKPQKKGNKRGPRLRL
ncbi:transposase [Ochrobactrum sp. GPK 3]